MHSDLMRAAGFQATFHVGISVKALPHMHVCDGRFPRAHRNNSHFLAVIAVTANVGADGDIIFGKFSAADGCVSPLNAVLFQLFGKTTMSSIILADQQRARGVAVNAMHNARTHDAVDAG